MTVSAPAGASSTEKWHPICTVPAETQRLVDQGVVTAPPVGECIRIDLYLIHSAGVALDIDRINAQIDMNECTVTMTDGSTHSVAGHHHFDVSNVNSSSSAHRVWHLPKGCAIKVHARLLMPWYDKDEIYTFQVYGEMADHDVCLRMDRYYQTQGTCDEVPG